MITTGLKLKRAGGKGKGKNKGKRKKTKTRGELAVMADLTKRLGSLDPQQVQIWIPNTENVRHLVVQVAATDGLWAGIPWRIHVVFPETYTIKEPSFKLDPAWKIFHPNVSLEDNSVCLGFSREWSPEYHLAFQCQMMLSILSNINERDPLNQPAGLMIIGDKDNHTTHFVDLVKRTLKGGNVDVPVTATGDVKETTKFPSRDEMAALATHVPPSWVDAREFVAKLSGATVAPSPNEVAAAATAEAAAAAALADK